MAANLPAGRGMGNPEMHWNGSQMMRISSSLAIVAAVLTTACAAPPPPPPPEAPPRYEFAHTRVWTAYPAVAIRGDSVTATVPRPFTALAVQDADSVWITVTCESCEGAPSGRVRHDEVLYDPKAPTEAAYGSMAEFALAVRDAAERADLLALAPVMAEDFTFSLVGLQGAGRARAAWAADGFEVLSRVPELLDRGLSRAGAGLWVAPPEYLENPAYHGLRIGFRRSAGGAWQWLFLVRGQGVGDR